MSALVRFLESRVSDLRFSVRTLARSPVFVLVTVLSLAIGIAGATGLFSLINAALLRPQPHVTDPDRLVAVHQVEVTRDVSPMSYPDYLDIRYQVDGLDDAAAVGHVDLTVTLPDGSERQIPSDQVSENYFQVAGVALLRGRGFLPDDGDRNWDVVVLGHRMWQQDFGGDDEVIGSTVRIDGRPHAIVGVAPPGMLACREPFALDLWVPIRQGWRARRGSSAFWVLGRMREGVTIASVQAQLEVLAQRLVESYPERWRDRRGMAMALEAISERESRIPPQHRPQFIAVSVGLMTIVILVLLVACSNVANLQLARAARRRQEIAVRLALGAGRRRLVGQLLTESVVLAALAGSLGLLITHVLTDLFAKGRGPIDLPVAIDLTIDYRVAAFSLVLALVTGVAFGLAPALQASRPDLAAALKGQENGPGLRRLGLRNLLVIAQVAGSLVLVVAAALLLRSFQNMRVADLGFDPVNVALVSVDLSQRDYGEVPGRQFFADLSERLRAVPGVEGVTMARTVMLGPLRMGQTFAIDGHEPAPGEVLMASFNVVSPGYFELMRMPLVQGRDFAATDTAASGQAAIVNQAFARRFWPGQDPIGRQVRLGGHAEAATVVGVVRDAACHEIAREAEIHLWVPFGQRYQPAMSLHVRTGADPRPLLATFREQVRALDPELSVTGLELMETVTARATTPQQVMSGVLGAAGGLTLGLAMMGIYGVMAVAVSQRRREVGIRIAVGAEPRSVVAMIVREGLHMSALGMVVGLVLVIILTRLAASLLYGVGALDPLSLGGGLGLLLLASLAAVLPVAVRAARVDPVESLRAE